MQKLRIINFEAQYVQDFHDLNIEWLEKYYHVEDYDREVLGNPEKYIISPGGHILFAIIDNKVVGTLALINRQRDGLELSKMAVTESFQGHSIGKRLIYAGINRAIELGTTRLFLDSNTKLKPALNLYRRVGFKEIPVGDSPYDRCDIRMEIKFT